MLLFLNGVVFSQITSQLSLGFEDANSFEANINRSFLYIPSLGIDLTGYTFINGNFGVFVHTELIFPVSGDFQIYDSSVILNALVGPAYRLPVNSAFEVVFGFGLNVSGTFIRYAQSAQSSGQIKYERNDVSLGLGGDIRIKWFIKKIFYINTGGVLSWNFSNYSSVKSKYGDYAGFTRDYIMFSVNPYVGVGVQFPFKTGDKE
ncbi:hypothetical protein AGMMS49991_10560 [Spirochaetia bacterium]|nr:hypothetical protein AGMMS49991_10560 [Spirochaetia bacterium]